MPNRVVEIHDSVLASISITNGRAELVFSDLYVHESEGEPGVDAGRGWFQKGVLRIDNAELKGKFSEFPVDLEGGTAHIREKLFDNSLPLPLTHKGRFELHLLSKSPSESVSFAGTAAELELVGDPGPVEQFRR